MRLLLTTPYGEQRALRGQQATRLYAPAGTASLQHTFSRSWIVCCRVSMTVHVRLSGQPGSVPGNAGCSPSSDHRRQDRGRF